MGGIMKKTYYLDDDNNIVKREESTHFIVQEFDDKGRFIGEQFGFNNQNNLKKEKSEMIIIEPSSEIQAVLDSYTDRHGNHPFRKK
jgi:hypothetical protein